jgi:hypothetical protein
MHGSGTGNAFQGGISTTGGGEATETITDRPLETKPNRVVYLLGDIPRVVRGFGDAVGGGMQCEGRGGNRDYLR